MRSISIAAVATGILGSQAISLVQPRDGTAPKVVQNTLYRNPVSDPVARDRARLARRQGDTVEVTLDNEETLYFMNLSIGTPPQALRLHIDTGSSDLWVNTPTSRLCSNSRDPCADARTYSANDSSTYRYINSRFNISYVDGSGSSGDYVSDTVQFGGVSLTDQQMGIGYVSSSAEGILGIGYALNEVAVAYNRGQPYANVPQKLVDQGYTNVNAYSLWLNDLDSSTGSILFGGVDTAKYTGSLVTLPVVPERGYYAEFVVALTGVGLNGNTGSIASNMAVPALLDSGSSLMYLPDDIAVAVYQATGAQYSARDGVAIINCNQANNKTTVDFTFSGKTISVDMSELVIPAAYSSTGRLICILGVMPAGRIAPVLGDTFLRSAYVVYDLQNNQISLAQTNFNSTDSNIIEIAKTGSVPSATVAVNAVSTVSYQPTGGARNGGLPTGIITISSGVAAPTATAGFNVAYLGAVGAGLMLAM